MVIAVIEKVRKIPRILWPCSFLRRLLDIMVFPFAARMQE